MQRIGCLLIAFFLVPALSFPQVRGLITKTATDAGPQIQLDKDQICNVYSIAFSPDGKYIAAGYSTNEIRLWDARTGALVKTFLGHSGIVWSVAFSPDGKTLVSGSADKTLKCWDVESGKELRTMQGHSNTVSFVVFSTDGEYIASGSADKTIKFWDPTNGKLLQTLTGHTRTIASIAYSRNGKFMASGSWDKTIKIYYAVGGQEIMTLTGHSDSVFAVAFSPDGKHLASGSSDRTIKIWDTATGKVQRELSGYGDAVWSLAYSPDGKQLVGSSADGGIKVWDTETGQELRSLVGHTTAVRSVNYSSDGKYISSGDSGGLIKLWNPSTGECLASSLKGKNGEWVTWTPEGFLTGSPWALKNLSYSANGKKYPISQIYDKIYRPDLVTSKISGGNLAKIAETDSFVAIVRTGTMPDVTFTVQHSNESERDAMASVKITNTGGGIGRVLLQLNERSILLYDKIESKPGQTITLEQPVTLRNGENTVSFSAYDFANAQESAKTSQKVTWKGQAEKPRLFIFTVAVNSYLDPSVGDLKNSVADADGIIDSFTKYSGDIYTDFYVQKLTGPEVTRDNLEKTLQSMGKNVKPDDVFVCYLAGHGKTYTDGDYYFIPYDFQFTSEEAIAENGVSKWELVKDLSNVQASHMLILLDTCNAGSFLTKKADTKNFGEVDRRAIGERFAEKMGYDMIAACSTYQYALDDYNGHGTFTYHIIEALQGYADRNKDGRIDTSEFADYIVHQVPYSSEKKWGYKQEPQMVLPSLDFPLVGRENPLAAVSLKQEVAAVLVPEVLPSPPTPIPTPPEESATVSQQLQGEPVDLFPVDGITLGKTTVLDLSKIGKKGDKEYYEVNGYNIWYFKNTLAESIRLVRDIYTTPEKWKSLGFDYHKSFNEWIALAKALRWSVVRQNKPYFDSDGWFRGEVDFQYQSNGFMYKIELTFLCKDRNCDENSPDTLWGIDVRFVPAEPVKISQSSETPNAVGNMTVVPEKELTKASPKDRSLIVAGWVCVGTGVLAEGLAMTTGILGNSAYKNYQNANSASDINSYRDSSQTMGNIMIGSLVSGGVLIVSGVVMLMWDNR